MCHTNRSTDITSSQGREHAVGRQRLSIAETKGLVCRESSPDYISAHTGKPHRNSKGETKSNFISSVVFPNIFFADLFYFDFFWPHPKKIVVPSGTSALKDHFW